MTDALNVEHARLDVALARHEALRDKQRRDCDPYPFLDDEDIPWAQRMNMITEHSMLPDVPRD